MRIHPAASLLALLSASLLAGCSPSAGTPLPPPVSEYADLPTAPDRRPTRVPLSRETIDQLNRMAFWLDALVPDGITDPVWQAHGFSLAQTEYQAALRDFLGHREPTPALIDAFHQSLDEQFLLLRHLEMGQLDQTEALLARARPAIRARLAELILDTLMGDWEPSTADLQALYEARRDEFSQPERVRVRIMLLETPEDAADVLELLDNDADFRQVAMERSIHESRADGGELQEFSRGTFAGEFERLAFSLDPGERGIITTGPGTFLIEKVSHTAASYTPLEQVRPQLARELTERHREELLLSIRAQIDSQP